MRARAEVAVTAPPERWQLDDPPWGRIDPTPTSLDGTRVSELEEDMVDRWIAMGSGGGYREVCVVELVDGRFVSWSTFDDVTGSGFHHDAYGGNADIFFGASLEVVLGALSEQDREGLHFFEVVD